MKKYIIAATITLSVVAWLLLIPQLVSNSYLKVESYKIVKSDLVNTVSCKGRIEAAVQQNLVVGVPVMVSQINFCIGDSVKPGDKLLEIDKDTTMQTMAFEKTANSILGTGLDSGNIDKQQALDSLSQALSLGMIDQNTYDKLKESLDGANSSTETGVDYSALAAQTASGTDILESIDKSLYSKISGVITNIKDGTSGVLPSATTLATIVDMNTLKVNTQVNENDIKNIREGQQAIITGEGFEGTYKGTVKKIYPVVDNNSNSDNGNYVTVEIAFDKADKKIKPGSTTNVLINVSEIKDAVTVPYDYIKQEKSGDEYVYVFNNGKAEKRIIKTGNDDNNAVQITSGLKSGEIVLKDKQNILTEGSNVRLH